MTNCFYFILSIRLSAVTKFVTFVLFTLVYIYITYNSMPKSVRVTRSKNITWKILRGIDEGEIDLYALEEEMVYRRELVSKVCQRYKPIRQPKMWQFVIDAHHSLVWCKVHKAASDTWIHYFNILGGYDEKFLRKTKRNPMSLLRSKFPTPTMSQLQQALRNSISFIIVRDPLERLLSTYLSIVEPKNNKYYGKLVQRIRKMTADGDKKYGPTFTEFVKYILENKEDEYWGTTYDFCSPCMINFTVIVKLETLLGDQEYILKRAGIEDILKPAKVKVHYWAHEKGRTRNFLAQYYSQLDFNLLYSLVNMYQIDYDLFGYNVSKYFTYITEE